MDAALPTASQRTTRSFGEELLELARLGGPIAFVQLGMTTLGYVDVAMLGHYREGAMPAMALGNTLTWSVLVFGMGIVTAVDPLLSQAVGARDQEAITRTLVRGALLCLLLTVPAVLLLWPVPLWLELLQQKPELIAGATTYARINTLGILPFLGFALVRTFLSAHSRLWPQIVAIVLGNLLNALLDWLWVFGKWGCPELGIAGSAWATVVGRWFMFALLVALSWRELGPHVRRLGDASVRAALAPLRPVLHLLRLGLPIGGQYLLEMGVFALSLLLIGQFDAAAAEPGGPRLGGHQVAIQLASMSFMVPLGIGMAASVRVGWAIGRGEPLAARRTAQATLCAGATVMTLFMLLFLLCPGTLIATLTNDPAITKWALVLLPIAGVFQIGDGLQVTAIGCLRGIGDVRSPFVANIACFWCLGLPLGCWLAFPWGRDQGPAGLWWGLTAGLFGVAAVLLLAMRLRFRAAGARLRVD